MAKINREDGETADDDDDGTKQEGECETGGYEVANSGNTNETRCE
jgi:hypothetical protein